MPFYRIRMLNGTFMTCHINMGRRSGPPPCHECGDIGSRLCDYKDPSGITCDMPLCTYCTKRVGKDSDLCPRHAQLVGENHEEFKLT